MISKFELQSIINKYYLNGLVEAVKWDIKDNNLNIKFTAPSREMIGEIEYDNFKLEDSSIGISNTSQLLKLINIASGEILLNYIKTNKIFTKLILSDNQFTVNYSLADILTIPKTGAYNGSQEFDIETDLNIEIITALIKAKSALAESNTVMLRPSLGLDGEDRLELIFGGDIEYANKVSYFISDLKQNSKPSSFDIAFNSDLFKEILSVNKDAKEAKMYINLEGLIKLEFKSDNTKSTYYIVKKDV
jgi:hypothetical protein